MNASPISFPVLPDQAGTTLAALVRLHQPGQSWSQVRRFIETRHVKIDGALCLDPARRVKEGESIEILARPEPKPRQEAAIVIRYLDEHLVVVEKPAGMNTVRHPSERDWPAKRKALSPTLQDLVPKLIAAQERSAARGPLPRLRIVQRLDKETSGLVVFARSVLAERELGRQFKAHTVTRRYLAIVPGRPEPGRIESQLVRDRGDGRRGSGTLPDVGKRAVTHVEVLEQLPGYSLVGCRLETGRTHQIRIHLAERGHPICGEKVYNRPYPPSSLGGEGPGLRGQSIADASGAPRLALHAVELGFVHPVTGKPLHWEMPLPADLQAFLDRLRTGAAKH